MRKLIAVPAKPKRPTVIQPAPHVRSGYGLMKIRTPASEIHGKAPKDRGYHDSNGRESARARVIMALRTTGFQELEAKARKDLNSAMGVTGKKGLSKCKCMGKCGCNQSKQLGLMSAEQLLNLLTTMEK